MSDIMILSCSCVNNRNDKVMSWEHIVVKPWGCTFNRYKMFAYIFCEGHISFIKFYLQPQKFLPIQEAGVRNKYPLVLQLASLYIFTAWFQLMHAQMHVIVTLSAMLG